MRVQLSPFPVSGIVRRGAALALSVLMAAGPVLAQDAPASRTTTPPGTAPSAIPSHRPETASKRTKQTASKAGTRHAPAHVTGRGSSRAARIARTARLKQAFVASTELRPMAQQLALMRTAEAYA